MSDTQTTIVNSKETGKEPGRESQKETTEAISALANQTATKPAAKTEGSTGQGLCDPQSREPLYNRPLFVIVTSMLVIQLVLLVGSLWFQYRNYAFGIALAQQAGAGPESVSLILIYSRAWDFAVTKTVSLFLGYMVLYTGALYVLRSADTSYELSIAQGTQQGASLKTSSPGLVLVTLGGALIALVGAMLIYGAYDPPSRRLALLVGSVSKLIFIGLVLSQGGRYLAHQAGVAVVVDLIMVALFIIYLLGTRRKML